MKDVTATTGILMHLRKYWINILHGKLNGLSSNNSLRQFNLGNHCNDFNTFQIASGPFTAFNGSFPSFPKTSIASYFSIVAVDSSILPVLSLTAFIFNPRLRAIKLYMAIRFETP